MYEGETAMRISVTAALRHARNEVGKLDCYGYRNGYRAYCYTKPAWGTDCHMRTEPTWYDSARRSRQADLLRAAIYWINSQMRDPYYVDADKIEQHLWSGWSLEAAVKQYLAEAK